MKLKPFSATTIPPKKCCDILEGLTFGSGKLFSKSLKKHFLTRHGRRNTWIHIERICRLIANENNLIKSLIQQIERGFTLRTLCFNCSQLLLWTLNGWQEGNFASTSLSAPPKNTSDSIFTNITVSQLLWWLTFSHHRVFSKERLDVFQVLDVSFRSRIVLTCRWITRSWLNLGRNDNTIMGLLSYDLLSLEVKEQKIGLGT